MQTEIMEKYKSLKGKKRKIYIRTKIIKWKMRKNGNKLKGKQTE